MPSSRPPTRGGEFKIGCETLAVVRLLSCAENNKRTTTRCVRGRVSRQDGGFPCQRARCPLSQRRQAVRGGGYLRHARTRHRASVRGYTRRRFRCRSMPPHWRHLRFTVQRRWSPKEDGRYDSTSFCDLSIPARDFFAEIPASYPSRSSLRFLEKGVAIGARAYPQSVLWHTHNRLACFP